MKLSEIPIGHLAKIVDGIDGEGICYRGRYVYVWVHGCATGLSEEIERSCSDYEDLGELKIDVVECMKYVVKATVE